MKRKLTRRKTTLFKKTAKRVRVKANARYNIFGKKRAITRLHSWRSPFIRSIRRRRFKSRRQRRSKIYLIGFTQKVVAGMRDFTKAAPLKPKLKWIQSPILRPKRSLRPDLRLYLYFRRVGFKLRLRRRKIRTFFGPKRKPKRARALFSRPRVWRRRRRLSWVRKKTSLRARKLILRMFRKRKRISVLLPSRRRVVFRRKVRKGRKGRGKLVVKAWLRSAWTRPTRFRVKRRPRLVRFRTRKHRLSVLTKKRNFLKLIRGRKRRHFRILRTRRSRRFFFKIKVRSKWPRRLTRFRWRRKLFRTKTKRTRGRFLRVRNSLGSYNSRRVLRRSMRRFISKTFRFMRRKFLRQTVKTSPSAFGHPATRRVFRILRSRVKSARFGTSEKFRVGQQTFRSQRRISGRKFLQQLSLFKALSKKVRKRRRSRLGRNFILKHVRAMRSDKLNQSFIKSRLASAISSRPRVRVWRFVMRPKRFKALRKKQRSILRRFVGSAFYRPFSTLKQHLSPWAVNALRISPHFLRTLANAPYFSPNQPSTVVNFSYAWVVPRPTEPKGLSAPSGHLKLKVLQTFNNSPYFYSQHSPKLSFLLHNEFDFFQTLALRFMPIFEERIFDCTESDLPLAPTSPNNISVLEASDLGASTTPALNLYFKSSPAYTKLVSPQIIIYPDPVPEPEEDEEIPEPTILATEALPGLLESFSITSLTETLDTFTEINFRDSKKFWVSPVLGEVDFLEEPAYSPYAQRTFSESFEYDFPGLTATLEPEPEVSLSSLSSFWLNDNLSEFAPTTFTKSVGVTVRSTRYLENNFARAMRGAMPLETLCHEEVPMKVEGAGPSGARLTKINRLRRGFSFRLSRQYRSMRNVRRRIYRRSRRVFLRRYPKWALRQAVILYKIPRMRSEAKELLDNAARFKSVKPKKRKRRFPKRHRFSKFKTFKFKGRRARRRRKKIAKAPRLWQVRPPVLAQNLRASVLQFRNELGKLGLARRAKKPLRQVFETFNDDCAEVEDELEMPWDVSSAELFKSQDMSFSRYASSLPTIPTSKNVFGKNIAGSQRLLRLKSSMTSLSIKIKSQLNRKIARLRHFRAEVRNYIPRPILRQTPWRKVAHHLKRLRRKKRNNILETHVPNIYTGPLGVSKAIYPEDYSDPHDDVRYLMDSESVELGKLWDPRMYNSELPTPLTIQGPASVPSNRLLNVLQEAFSMSSARAHYLLVPSTVIAKFIFFWNSHCLAGSAASQFGNTTVAKMSHRSAVSSAPYFFMDRASNLFQRSNLHHLQMSTSTIRYRVVRSIANLVFAPQVIVWYYKTFVQFAEVCTGRKVAVRFGPFAEEGLNLKDRALCSTWESRLTRFQRILGHRIFAKEGLRIIVLSIRLKDPHLLANWLRGMLKRMSFWKYRLIFRFLKFILRSLLMPYFSQLGFRGFKLKLTGKISVAGNARSRTLFQRIGYTSHTRVANKVSYDLSLVNTFTGVMGFRIWFFY